MIGGPGSFATILGVGNSHSFHLLESRHKPCQPPTYSSRPAPDLGPAKLRDKLPCISAAGADRRGIQGAMVYFHSAHWVVWKGSAIVWATDHTRWLADGENSEFLYEPPGRIAAPEHS